MGNEAGEEKEATIKIAFVSGPEGDSAYLGGLRIAGPKPWGGGKDLFVRDARLADVIEALIFQDGPRNPLSSEDALEIVKRIKKYLKSRRQR